MKETAKSKNNTSRIRYRHFKNYKPQNVLLLHGFLGSQHIWDPLITAFSEYFNMIVPDLPGHGESTCIPSKITMDEIADLIFEIMQKEKIDTFHVVGHSMGGYVGLEMLNKFPDSILSLTLLNSTAKDDSPEKKEDRLRAVRVFDLSPKVFIKEAITNLFFPANISIFEPEVSRLQEIALSTTVNGAQASLRGMRERKNFENLVNSTQIPIHYISGIYDNTVTYDSIKSQIQNDRIQLTTMESSGHMSFAEEKEKCEQAIINFIINL